MRENEIESKIGRLNLKTIRCDKKKWKDKVVLHYLISKWIFFLITFRRHQNLQILISPKSLILQNKEISWKWCSNSEMIEKTWLLQESITHPTAGFEVFVNKKPTFNCSINDAGTTIFLRCWDEGKKKNKQQILYSLSSSKTSLLRISDSISEKKIDWQQTIIIKLIGKDVGRRTKNSKCCAHCLRTKVRF